MTTLQEALPCPFCGKQHTLQVISGQELMGEDQEFWQHSESFGVVCDASTPDGKGGCGAMGGFKPTEDEAIEAWNTRTALAQQGELAEQMVSNTAMDYQLRALDICREAKKVSVSLVQRKLGLSYAAAQELCQSIVASGLVPGLPMAPSLIDVMAALTAGRATLAGAERVEFVDLKEQARRGCGNCFYQDCDYPNCITKRKPV